MAARKSPQAGTGCVVLFGIVFATAWLIGAGVTLWQSSDPTAPVTINDRPATQVEAQLFLCCFAMISVVAATGGLVIAAYAAGAGPLARQVVAVFVTLIWHTVGLGVATRPLFIGGPPVLGMAALLTYEFAGLLPLAHVFPLPGDPPKPRPFLVTLTKLGAGTSALAGTLMVLGVYLLTLTIGKGATFEATAGLHRVANYVLFAVVEAVLLGWFLGFRLQRGRLVRKPAEPIG